MARKLQETGLIHRLSTGCQQADGDGDGSPLDDLMDVPAFFGYDAVVDPTTQRVPRRAGTSPVWNVPVNTKPGVDVDLHPVMSRALEVASVRGDVITSGREGHPGDGVHKPNSLHYDGQAMDVRPTKDLDAQVKRYANLGYNVIVKKRPYHLHVSRDPEGQRV